jgi:peptide/nickel transport system substrate-binding protein
MVAEYGGKLLRVVVVLVVLAGLLSSPDALAATAVNTTLTIVVGSDVVALHPSDVSDAASEAILLNIYEPLVFLSPKGKVEPLLAESWKVIDEVTYQFRLRKNVRFHNGQILTADDVVGSINELLKPANGKPYRNTLFTVNIKEAIKNDQQTVTIKTTVPFGPFLRNLAQLRIVPTKISREELGRKAVGTGPYRLVEYVEGSHFVLERFDQYWGPKPAIARVIFRIVPEASARVAEVQAGRADIVTPLVPELVPVVQRTRGFRVVVAPGTYRVTLTYNTRLDTPIRNPKVRQALNYAVNYEAIIKSVLGGFGRRTGPLIEQDLGYNPYFKDYVYDPSKARALLTEAGYPNGFEVVIATPQGRYVKDKEVAEAVAGMFREVGVNARVQVNEWGSHVAQILGHNIAPIYLIGWRGVNFDPSAALIAWDCAGAFANYCNPQVQELLRIGLNSVAIYKRVAAYRDALSFYLVDPPALYLFQETALYAVREGVRWTPRVDQLILVKTISRK